MLESVERLVVNSNLYLFYFKTYLGSSRHAWVIQTTNQRHAWVTQTTNHRLDIETTKFKHVVLVSFINIYCTFLKFIFYRHTSTYKSNNVALLLLKMKTIVIFAALTSLPFAFFEDSKLIWTYDDYKTYFNTISSASN